MKQQLRLTYCYPRGMNRDGLLYNAPALQEQTARPCYIVEGSLDALALWPDAVAVLGKPLKSQLRILAAAKRPLVVALDGDAWNEGQALAWTLQSLGVRAASVRLPPKTDPDEVPRNWLDGQAAGALRAEQARLGPAFGPKH
jgi:DNA primase